jgi:hypothetical protein
MSTYAATTPPDGATCDTCGCRSAAVVRLLIPPSRFTADGQDHDHDPAEFDLCELHWPKLRDASERNGHTVVDATGDLGRLAADFPHWSVFASDGGRLYASTRPPGRQQGITLDACLVGQLRAKIRAAQDAQTTGQVLRAGDGGG